MIQFADDLTKQAVRDMWKEVFGDSDDYMDIYFKHKYQNENTLIYIEDNKPVASLQLLIYNFTFYGKEIPVAYHSGLCTLPDYRGRGYMKELIVRSYRVATERNIPLMILVPQDEGLLNYYDKFGFSQTFDSCSEMLPSLLKIMEQGKGNLHEAYELFDSNYRHKDMTVQKTYEDFEAIVEEAKLFNYPPKRTLIGMARVIDAEYLISLFAEMNKEQSFVLRLEDELLKRNNAIYKIMQGKVEKESISNDTSSSSEIDINIRDLAQLLLGYHTSEMREPLKSLFPEKKPAMHFMLE